MKNTLIKELSRLTNETAAMGARYSQARFANLQNLLGAQALTDQQATIILNELVQYANQLEVVKLAHGLQLTAGDAALSSQLDEYTQRLAQQYNFAAPKFASAPISPETAKNKIGKNLLDSILGLVKNLANPQMDMQHAFVSFFADFMKTLVSSFTGMVRQYAGEEAGRTMEEIGKQVPAVINRMMSDSNEQRKELEERLHRAEFDYAARRAPVFAPAMQAQRRMDEQEERINTVTALIDTPSFGLRV